MESRGRSLPGVTVVEETTQQQHSQAQAATPFTDDEVDGSIGQVLQRVRNLPSIHSLNEAAKRH
eukprot:8596706-Pyramimonas_sp.AAC.1